MDYIAVTNEQGCMEAVVREQEKNQQQEADHTFFDMLEGKNVKTEMTERMPDMEKSAARDLTMQEYQCYIYYLISNMPKHPSQKDNDVMVLISQAGFEAMKNDPAYEAWVLKDIQTYFSQNQVMSSYFGRADAVLFYGARKEDCYSQVRYPEYERKMQKKQEEERYRARREANRKRLKKLQQKRFLEQRALKKMLEQRYLEKIWLEKKELRAEYMEDWIEGRIAYENNVRAASMARKIKERSLFY